MSVLSVQPPFPIFTDIDGQPLEDGFIYIGTANQPPFSNPITVYTNAALTSTIAQPIRTLAGYPAVSGSPGRLYVNSDYSIQVQNKNGSVVYSAPAATERFGDLINASQIVYDPAGTGAVQTTVQTKLRQTVSVADFIPAGTNTAVTDCQPFIQAAINEVIARGGDTLFFPAGTYNLVGTSSDGTVSAHFTLKDVQGINFLGYGAVLKSSYSNTSYAAVLFNLNGCRRMNFEGFDIEGTFSRTLSVVNQYSIIAFYVRSADRDSESLSLRNMRMQNVYTVLTVYGDGVSSRRVRTVLVENVFATNGYYGLNFQENGDNVTAINFRTNQFIRSYFPYGVSNHQINYTSTNGDVFTDCLIKAYKRDTINLTVNALIIGNTSNDSHVTIESQHAPATQPTPASLRNIVLNINDLQSSGTGPSLRFAYFQDTPSPTPTPVSATTLFNNITVRGNVRSFLQFAVAQPTNSGAINLQGLVYLLAGSGDPYDFGFYEPVSRYAQGNNSYSFQVAGNKQLAAFGGVTFGQYNGAAVGYFDGTNGTTSFKLVANPNYPYRFEYAAGYPSGTLVYEILGNTGGSFGVRVYEGANNGSPNASAAILKIGNMDGTGRSINAAGTLNASGTDYAEYELNNGLVIAKGSVVGFKADGTLTLTFSEAVRFGVKSTHPSFVGGDTWATEAVVGAAPERPARKSPVLEKGFDEDGRHIDIIVEPGDSDDEWQSKLDAYNSAKAEHEAKIEAERAKVDRVAYSGKVPVNVTGAKPSDYIVAVNNNGKIDGMAVENPTFEQYKLAIGRVNRILDDGRAEIAVIVH